MAKNATPKASRKATSQSIRIACTGASTIPIDDLTDFQGDLKVLSDESFNRLRMSILDLGFSFPVQAWKNKGKTFILDAHQRVAVLKRMRDQEGFTIPPLPVIWVEASSRQEAAKKLLAATSQYGEVTPQGLFDYLTEFKIELPKIESEFQFPEINMDDFRKAFFTTPEEFEVSFKAKKKGAQELDSSDFEQFTYTCPKCNFGFD